MAVRKAKPAPRKAKPGGLKKKPAAKRPAASKTATTKKSPAAKKASTKKASGAASKRSAEEQRPAAKKGPAAVEPETGASSSKAAATETSSPLAKAAATVKTKAESAGSATEAKRGAAPAEVEAAEKPTRSRFKDLPPPSKDMSRDELTRAYAPYVRSIAGKIKKTLAKGIEFDDLMAYGALGLYEAADRFDPKYGVNFMTFSYYRIRGAIYDGLRSMGWVSRTEYQRYRYEAAATHYLQATQEEESQRGDAARSNTEEVGALADVVGGLATIFVTALDAMEGFQVKDDRGPGLEESVQLDEARALVADAVSRLPEQERTLLELYYYKEMSLEQVGGELGLSKSWTSRLHARAIEKLTRLLGDLVAEIEETEGRVPKSSKSAGATGPPGG